MADTQGDIKFGKVAASMGLLDQKDLDQAYQLQKSDPAKRPLQVFLVETGMLTTHQANTILEQAKHTKLLVCSLCQKKHVIHPYIEGRKYTCLECKVEMELSPEEKEGGAETSTKKAGTDAPKPEVILLGVSKNLELQLPEESWDDMCEKRVQDYMILSRLGGGAMGVVYKAQQIKLQRAVALKMLLPKFSQDEFYRKRFMIEFRSAAKLNHPNILQIFDADSCDGRLFFSMEYIQGESVKGVLDRLEKISVVDSLDIITQMAQAFTEMYEHKIVHRDIKPENIMLTAKGIAKLADLGLAKSATSSPDKSDKAMIMGTPYYIAPEAISSPLAVDHRADIYSLGATFYRMVTGVLPFFNADPLVVLRKVGAGNLPLASAVNKDVPDSIGWVIDKMMQKKPEDRFQTPMELLEVLQELKEQVAKPGTKASSLGLAAAGAKPPATQPIGNVDTSNLGFMEAEEAKLLSAPAADSTLDPTLDPTLMAEPEIETPKASPTAATPAKREILKTGTLPKMKTDETPKARSQPAEPAVPPEEAPASKTPMYIGIGVLCCILIMGFVIHSNKKAAAAKKILQEQAKAEKIRLAKEEEIAKQNEKRKQEYVVLQKQIDEALANETLAELEIALPKAKSFRQSYSGTNESKSLNEYIPRLEDKIISAKAKQAYQQLEAKVAALMAQGQFIQADKEAGQSAGFSSTTLQEAGKKLQEQVAETAKQRCQHVWEQTQPLQQNGQYKEVIAMLKEAQKNQFKENIAFLEEKMVSLAQNIKKCQMVLEIRDKMHPLVAVQKFAEAQDVVNKEELSQENWGSALKTLIEEITVLENGDKQLMDILGKELKNKSLRFEFAKDDKKEDMFDGKVLTVTTKRRYVTISTNKGTVNRPIDQLTWGCKKEVLAQRLKKSSEIEYLLAMMAIMEGDIQKLEKEVLRLPEEVLQKIYDPLAFALCIRIKKLAKEQKGLEIAPILDKFKNVYTKSQSWRYLRDGMSEFLWNTGNNIRDRQKAHPFYKIVVEYLPGSSHHKACEAKMK